jgi:hypothetical protein
MMKKGKGYLEHVKNTDKSFGDPYAQDVTGGRNIRSSLNNLRITLGNGVAEDFAHYRQVVGSINSLEWARDNLTDIIKKRTYAEDD